MINWKCLKMRLGFHSLVYSFTHCVIYPLSHLLVHSFVCLSLYSLICTLFHSSRAVGSIFILRGQSAKYKPGANHGFARGRKFCILGCLDYWRMHIIEGLCSKWSHKYRILPTFGKKFWRGRGKCPCTPGCYGPVINSFHLITPSLLYRFSFKLLPLFFSGASTNGYT